MERKNVLIVEDAVETALALARALEHPLCGHHHVEVTTSADMALKGLGHCTFDLIITDLNLPGMNGLELIHDIRRIHPSTRLMLITAFGSPEIEERVERLGASYLSKPFGLVEFVQATQRILEEI